MPVDPVYHRLAILLIFIALAAVGNYIAIPVAHQAPAPFIIYVVVNFILKVCLHRRFFVYEKQMNRSAIIHVDNSNE